MAKDKKEAAGPAKPFRHHKVNKLKLAKKPSNRKGSLGKRVKFVREVISEIVGINGYEKKILECIKSNRKDKALKMAKKALGTHRRALQKRQRLETLLREKKVK